MIKFSKWMYELGYKAAIKNVLHEVDKIPLTKPSESDFRDQVRDEKHMQSKMNDAMITFSERRALVDFVHQKFDPDYEPELSDVMIKKILGEEV